MKSLPLLIYIILFAITTSAQQDKVENPIQNFEKLWSEFGLRYANFE